MNRFYKGAMRLLVAVVALAATTAAFSQTPTLPADVCYTFADNGSNGQADYFSKYDPATNVFTKQGAVGGTSSNPKDACVDGAAADPMCDIEAAEFNPNTQILYAASGGWFGAVDTTSGNYQEYGQLTTAGGGQLNGALGAITLNDVDGLIYDPVGDFWYGSERLRGGSCVVDPANTSGACPEDLLFAFTVNDATQEVEVISDFFGAGVDYVAIAPPAADGSLTDIDDLAINPLTGQLVGIANNGNGSDTYIVVIDKTDGTTTASPAITVDGVILKDVEGLTVDKKGNYFITTGSEGETDGNDNFASWAFALDLDTGVATPLANLESNPTPDLEADDFYEDFEAFSCLVYIPASVGDYVWLDANSNGQQDGGELPIEGAKVTLIYIAPDGTEYVVGFQTTDAAGAYLFEGVVPIPDDGSLGQYVIEFGSPMASTPGGIMYNPFELTIQDAAADGVDSDADPNTGRSAPFTLDEAEANLTIDAGFVPSGTIGDTIWEDTNGDGVQDPGESGIPGVTVYLIDPVTGDTLDTAVTDANGEYLFTNLPVSDDPANPICYHVAVDVASVEAALGQPVVNSGDPDGGFNSMSETCLHFDPSAPVADIIDTTTDLDQDFGYVPQPPGSIGDYVWCDENGDGIQQDGEAPVEGATVNLYLEDGTLVATTTTAADGSYLFDNLAPSSITGQGYVVEFVAPDGKIFTTPDQGGDDTADSDADPTTGRTPPIDLGPGEDVTDVDAGVVDGTGSLGDYVWCDENGDGIQQDGEAPVEGATVNLYAGDGVTLIATTTTAADGSYLFDDLAPGDYIVEFVAPDGKSFTTPDQGGDDTADSDADPTTGRTPVITIGPGDDVTDVDAGVVYPTGTIGDKIFEDVLGGDGPGFEGVTVILEYIDPATGQLVTVETVTDANGNYLFTDLPLDPNAPVEFTVCVDLTTLPDPGPAPREWENTSDPDGGLDSKSVTSLTVDAPEDLDQDFGYQRNIALPVELVSFSADQQKRNVVLSWETASETDNSGWEIQSMFEGKTSFETVGFVSGAGTTTESSSYEFVISDLAFGNHSFRLKQIDFGGDVSFSSVVEFAVDMPDAFILDSAYPNPFNPQATIRFAVRESENVSIDLYDVNGRHISNLYLGTPEAKVSQDVRIDGSSLSSGTYVVRLTARGFSTSQLVTLLK